MVVPVAVPVTGIVAMHDAMLMAAVVVPVVVVALDSGLEAADVLVGIRIPVDSDRGVLDAELISKYLFDAFDHDTSFLV